MTLVKLKRQRKKKEKKGAPLVPGRPWCSPDATYSGNFDPLPAHAQPTTQKLSGAFARFHPLLTLNLILTVDVPVAAVMLQV